MKFHYQPTPGLSDPLAKRLGLFPRIPDLTWDFFRWWGGWLSVLFVRSQFKLSVTGSLPNDSRVAVVANHQSHLDTAALLAALPYGRRKDIVVLAAEDYFFQDTPKALLASILCQGVAFDRLHWTTIRRWYEHLKSLPSGWILFYPSGSRHSKTLQPGLLKVLLKAGWTILPARLEGADTAWPAHAKYWRPFQRLRVTFGQPYRGQDITVLLNKLEEELHPS